MHLPALGGLNKFEIADFFRPYGTYCPRAFVTHRWKRWAIVFRPGGLGALTHGKTLPKILIDISR
jgi:hypothetical protein